MAKDDDDDDEEEEKEKKNEKKKINTKQQKQHEDYCNFSFKSSFILEYFEMANMVMGGMGKMDCGSMESVAKQAQAHKQIIKRAFNTLYT